MYKGRVPSGYWNNRSNQQSFMQEISKKLNIFNFSTANRIFDENSGLRSTLEIFEISPIGIRSHYKSLFKRVVVEYWMDINRYPSY